MGPGSEAGKTDRGMRKKLATSRFPLYTLVMSSIHSHNDSARGRSFLLMLTFLGLVIGLGFVFAQLFENIVILYAAIGISILMNFFGYWFSDKVALRSSGAQPADERQFRELHNIVENLSITAGIPKPRVYIIPDNVPNAFATGRNPEHAAVAVTEGLLHILDRAELEGVVAHELAHIKNSDILVATMAVVLAGFVSLLADFFFRSMLFGGGSGEGRGNSLALVGIFLMFTAPLFGTLLRLAVSRSREYMADASGALLTRYPEGLASALHKIHSAASHLGPMKRASQATAHLFIANPFGGAGKSLRNLFSTHPPVEERIRRLVGGV